MKIRDFKYTPEIADCRFRGRCRANGCPRLSERIEAGVIGYHEALEETFMEHTPLRQRVKIVSACSHCFRRDKAHMKRFVVAQVIFGVDRKRNTAVYLIHEEMSHACNTN